jgi:hypothetical protein
MMTIELGRYYAKLEDGDDGVHVEIYHCNFRGSRFKWLSTELHNCPFAVAAERVNRSLGIMMKAERQGVMVSPAALARVVKLECG